MAERKPARKATQKPAKTTVKAKGGLSDFEKAAVRERHQELKAEASRGGKADGEKAVLAKIAAMQGSDRAMGERLHALIRASAPALSPKTWYGMPAYAKAGKTVCFFRASRMFKERYMTFGFTQDAKLDAGNLWPTAFALTELTPAEEAKIGALVKKAVS